MNNNGNTLLGVLSGTVIGAALGILFAPDKEPVTRKNNGIPQQYTGHLYS